MSKTKQKSSHLRRQKAKAAKEKATASSTTLSKPAVSNDVLTSDQDGEDGTASQRAPAKSVVQGSSNIDVGEEYDLDNGTPLATDMDESLYEMYKGVIDRFQQTGVDAQGSREINSKPEILYNDDDEIGEQDDEDEDGDQKMSRKKRKELNKLSVAELKALVKKPEVVEWTDTSSSDPRLLVHIKSYRNVVPVPSHWSLKREYLSSKRGVEKAPFSLPKFIQETGIAEMRDAVLEKQAEQSLKQKQRERVQPKMGRLDIDYQKLYEAFFRFQTKPELTRYGEVYYEGKEYETNLKHLRPGELSDELKEALNMPPSAPPPWLLNQQRFGPPPSYPALRIPGLNAPLPPGGQWGFFPGGYGKAPVDEYNRPLYGGDVFGVIQSQPAPPVGEPVEKTLWGELQDPEDESEEESDEDEEEEEQSDEEVADGPGGIETPSGMNSMAPTEITGTESVAQNFNLRKQRRGIESEEPSGRALYQVLPEQQARAEGFFASDRRYEIPANGRTDVPLLGQEDSRKRKKPGDVEASINPDDLVARDGLDRADIQQAYDSERQQNQGQWRFNEDLSEMIAQESGKRQKRDEERRTRR